MSKRYLIETMPDYLRASHRAARNWGTYPANGAERSIVDEGDLPDGSDEYDHVVREATPADLKHYPRGNGPSRQSCRCEKTMIKQRYRVLNQAGGTEHTTDDLDFAVIAALELPMVGSVYDHEHGRMVDLSKYDLEYTDDDKPYLVERDPS